jgi:hypothetical protein
MRVAVDPVTHASTLTLHTTTGDAMLMRGETVVSNNGSLRQGLVNRRFRQR